MCGLFAVLLPAERCTALSSTCPVAASHRSNANEQTRRWRGFATGVTTLITWAVHEVPSSGHYANHSSTFPAFAIANRRTAASPRSTLDAAYHASIVRAWNLGADEPLGANRLASGSTSASRSLAAGSFVMTAMAMGGIACLWLRQRPTGQTSLRAKKRKTSKGPRKLKSGYWQEGDDEDDIDIFEWISSDDLEDEPPVSLSGLQEVAAYSLQDGLAPERYHAPEYRSPQMPLQLQKGIKRPPPLDQAKDRFFVRDVIEAISSSRREPYLFEPLDVIASLASIKTLLAFVDGSLTEDMRAKGLNTRRRNEPELVDLIRIARMPEAPRAICLATVWNWVPANTTPGVGALNRMSYDTSFERVATGKGQLSGPPSTRTSNDPLHYRMLEYNCGDLRMLIKVPVVATVPAVDLGFVEGQTVEMHSVNRRDAGDLWGSSLSSRYAEMQLGDVAMVSRGIVDKGSLIDLQELTREDLRLDRPGVALEADRLLGKLTGLLRRVRAVAECPGCKDRPLYLQYSDAELRVISPIFEDASESAVDDDEVEELLSYAAGSMSVSAI
eukprot:CAMPEP_0179051126 /NCGR_PEP_ID=MMETSP0796-20121207/21086_1 /TAXON_ID=73915 /ORGANISM="Pyrodinium bahamense, Strain pbaha01" /LENGTH=555 /DNA_ID=CAMNT_0020747661 /DNA_START=39 /DNA_END=1706 /DNA_ORIENTATION=-